MDLAFKWINLAFYSSLQNKNTNQQEKPHWLLVFIPYGTTAVNIKRGKRNLHTWMGDLFPSLEMTTVMRDTKQLGITGQPAPIYK